MKKKLFFEKKFFLKKTFFLEKNVFLKFFRKILEKHFFHLWHIKVLAPKSPGKAPAHNRQHRNVKCQKSTA